MKSLIRFIPALLWMAFIFFLSSQSTTGIGHTRFWRFLILKTFHLIEYAILYALLFFATNKPLPSAGFSYVYALTDELHQTFVPGREGKFVDTLIDLLGISIGLIAISQIIKINFFKRLLIRQNS